MPDQRKNRDHAPPLAGGGPSIVGVTGAMRARDVSRVRPKDAALAERRLVVKRTPPPDPPPADPPPIDPPRTS